MDIYLILQQLGIDYQRHRHQAVYTCEQANQFIPNLPGATCKNLFLRDRKGRNHFLLVAADDTSVDLNALAKQIGSSKLSLASPERLKQYLDVEPGAVSLLALLHDRELGVGLLVERGIWQQDQIQCHPWVNDETLTIAHQDIVALLDYSGHQPIILDL